MNSKLGEGTTFTFTMLLECEETFAKNNIIVEMDSDSLSMDEFIQ